MTLCVSVIPQSPFLQAIPSVRCLSLAPVIWHRLYVGICIHFSFLCVDKYRMHSVSAILVPTHSLIFMLFPTSLAERLIW